MGSTVTRGGTAMVENREAEAVAGSNKQLVVVDSRKGQEGWWVVSIDSLGRLKGEPRKLFPSDAANAAIRRDLSLSIYRKGDELWRLWTSTGKEERIGKALPGDVAMQSLILDGREVLWIRQDT